MSADLYDFLVQKDIRAREIKLYLAVHHFNGGVSVPTSVIMQRSFTKSEQGKAIDETPLLSMPFAAADTLLDELWKAGIRPTQATTDLSAGERAALQRTITEMQSQIIFLQSVINYQLGMGA